MTIGIIEELVAQKGREDEMGEFIEVVVRPRIERSPGNAGCFVYRRQDNPAQFVVIHQWKTTADHKAYLSAIPQEQVNHMRVLLGKREAVVYDQLE